MRVLLLTNYWPPEIGAASHLYYELSQELVSRGHQVTVLTGFPRYNIREIPRQYRGKLALWEDQNGVRVRRVKTLHPPQQSTVLRCIGHFLLALAYGASGLGLGRPDVLLMYSPPLPMGLAAGLLKRWYRCAFVLNVQDIFPQSAIDLGVLKHPFLIRLFEWFEKRIYSLADHITVHSEGNRENVVEKIGPAGKVSVMPNWIDTDFVRPGPRHNRFRGDLDLSQECIVSFAGTMGYSQDLDTVLLAADRLRDQPHIVFVLVGDGVEAVRLKQTAGQMKLQNVRWIPMQPRERYPSILEASDACLVTLHEAVRTPVVPSKLLSIMAAARPTLLSVWLEGDARRIVESAECGLCVPPGQPEALAEAVLTLCRDRELADRLGRNGRSYVEEHFSVGSAASRYESLFHGLVDKVSVR